MNIKIRGTEYHLLMDTYTAELMEQEFGGLKQAFEEFRNEKKHMNSTRRIFACMANSGRSLEGLPEDVKAGDFKHLSFEEMGQLADAVRKTLEDGMHSEKNGGEADDTVHDIYLDQIEAQENKKKEA